jgi:ubiquinol-cytochrome c reductase cytochrome c1 subunit
MKHLLIAVAALGFVASTAHAAGGYPPVPKNEWSFQGIRGKWDPVEILRGYEVATQVCLSCHSFKYFSHRNLIGAGLTEEQAKTLAAKLDMDLNQKLMSGLSDEDAKETYGGPVPDLSVMTKARPGGVDYVKALLLGYTDAPEGMDVGNGYYNKYFPGYIIAMPNPMSEGQVTYTDSDTQATMEQMAHDVAAFIAFVSEPELIDRKRLGVYVLLYLIIFTALAYALKNAIWRDIKTKAR